MVVSKSALYAGQEGGLKAECGGNISSHLIWAVGV